ncbi:MAG TPA: pyridoxamine 5'-phosphate oxidase family protein [Candidatus Elarobacter sp.]|nr:pyridoxamine 5'-phosphate oxidase family protein [Candidatus Elarobacter sp.]HEV2736963.1 pyridoxamine 5'-phosphate oxidase family protein [Candidatus Elarobacter sp.]
MSTTAPNTTAQNGTGPNISVRRLAERARYDRDDVDAILDAAYVAHVGVVVDGAPVVMPYACARVGDELVLHGSTKAGILSALASGTPVCATVTHVDGLVLARSAFHSSMNYRSAVVHGTARVVDDPDEKVRLLDALVDRLLPGRRAGIRGMAQGELDATQVVALALDRVSAKVRTGPPTEPQEDRDAGVWGGVIPLALEPGTPQADDVTAPDVAPPNLTSA